MTRKLPFNVAVFNAVVATFNSFDDAKGYALMMSAKYPDGWVELRDANLSDRIIVAYEDTKVVHGNG